MVLELSKKTVTSYCGDIIPLHIGFDSELHSVLAKADIKWSCSSDVVAIRTFDGNDKMCFNNGVLVVLKKVGSATVNAVLDGVTYTCNFTVRKPISASSDDELNFYFGDLHNHTTRIHSHNDFINRTSEFQRDFIEVVKNEGLMDVCAMTDHACVLNDTDFFRSFIEVEKAEPMDLVVFAGSEAEVTVIETDRFGVDHKNSGEIVTFNTDSYIDTLAWEPFCDSINNVPEPVIIFAHPNVIGFSASGVWNFCFHKNNSRKMLGAARGVETINGRSLSENLMHEFNYSLALDSGFKVSSVASTDSHGPDWGYSFSRAKTIVMAKEKSREAFLDAFRNNRFYATESGNVKLKYTVNGKAAPADLELAEKYEFHVDISYFAANESSEIVECSVISDGGKTVKKMDVKGTSLDFDIESDKARYFYLRLVDRDGRRTWSMPVWTGRMFDKYVEPRVKLIDLSNATAVDVLSGKDAGKAIDGDVYNPWEAETGKASVVIDLKEIREVCAIGNYPRIIKRPSRNDDPIAFKNWCESDYTATIPTAFEVYTSLDGKEYEKKADGISRMFGGENVVEFERTRARYVRFDVLSTVGADSVPHIYGGAKCVIGNLSVFE